MSETKAFKTVLNKNIEKLKMFVPIVNRVHGDTHPEFKQVKTEFDILIKKLERNDLTINQQFRNIAAITHNYEVPRDVCESYESVYVMLSELHHAFRKGQS